MRKIRFEFSGVFELYDNGDTADDEDAEAEAFDMTNGYLVPFIDQFCRNDGEINLQNYGVRLVDVEEVDCG